MLSVEQAHAELNKHLAEDAPKVQHSKVVASLMKHLAKTTGQDAVLWEVVGLCHDLDDAVTKADRRLHGLLAAGWLEGRLPGEALEAIQAHDHRTGLSSNTQLADALKLADALAIADKDVGREIISGIGSDAGLAELANRLVKTRPYLCPIITELADRMKIRLSSVAELFDNAPSQ